MRVLLANSTCKVGGVSTFMLSLHRALAALGHECRLFFFERGSMEPHLPPDVAVDFGTLADCLRLVERERIQVVHANNVDWHTGVSAVREIGAKMILTAHKVREGGGTYGWSARDCDAFVAVSRWIRDGLQPFTDVPVQVVPNGIDTDRFRPADRADTAPPIVAWVGRGGAPRKRLEAFAAIAPALRRAGLRVWVIDQQGPQTLAGAFPEAARALSEAADVWRGVPFDEMPEVYRAVAASRGCVISTASMEGLPLTLLEAQACGSMVIAADVVGVNECVSPVHGGVLYPLETRSDNLATLAIDSLRDRDAVRQRQHEAAAHVRQHFSLERMAAQYLRIYEESPYRVTGGVPGRLRALVRQSPLLDWKRYVERRWGVAHEQYATSRELAERGEWRLAAAAVRASIRVGPTLYLKPGRLAHVAGALWRSNRANRSPSDRFGPFPMTRESERSKQSP